MVLRGLIGKQSSRVDNQSQVSLKIALFTSGVMAVIILNSYRAVMNAFLAVQLYLLPISTFEDILNKNFQLLTYHQSSVGDVFRQCKIMCNLFKLQSMLIIVSYS